jgi:hypothetical protein
VTVATQPAIVPNAGHPVMISDGTAEQPSTGYFTIGVSAVGGPNPIAP